MWSLGCKSMACHAFEFLRTTQYPHYSSMAMFIDGPAPLAFAIGQSFDKNIHCTVHIPAFLVDGYEPAIVLQNSQSPLAAGIPTDPQNILQRTNTLRAIISAINDLKKQISRADKEEIQALSLLLSNNDLSAMTKVIQEVEIVEQEGKREEFELDIDERRLIFNLGLLHALAKNIADEKEKKRIGLLIFTHEAYHSRQG